MKKLLAVLLLLLFLASVPTVFAAGSTCNAAGRSYTTKNCSSLAIGHSCSDYYAWAPPDMKYCTVTEGICTNGVVCTRAACSLGGRAAIAACASNTDSATCSNYYSTGGASNDFCYWKGTAASCRAGDMCIPEFFGIDFGEMELSTGLIALITAIALPMVLFRRKQG